MNPTATERLIASLREMAQNISSKSLSEIQAKLREAAEVLERLDSDVEALEIVEEQFQEYVDRANNRY